MMNRYKGCFSRVLLFSGLLSIAVIAPTTVFGTEAEPTNPEISLNSKREERSLAAYTEAKASYTKAEEAKNEINQAIAEMAVVIASFPSDQIIQANYYSIDQEVADWKLAYDGAKLVLDTAYTEHLPSVLDYQEKNELYNASGTAPTNNIIEVYSPLNFEADFAAYIMEAEQASEELIDRAIAYRNYYEAHEQYSQAFDEYSLGWKKGNIGDPNDDHQKTWLPIINVFTNFLEKKGNFEIIGYSDARLKSMTTESDWEEFIATYERLGREAVYSTAEYGAYLLTVSDRWIAAKEEMIDAIAVFNATTGSDAQLSHWGDPLRMMLNRGLESSMFLCLEDSLELLNSFPFREKQGVTVYDWLRRTGNYLETSSYIRGQEMMDPIEKFPDFEMPNQMAIAPLEIYELLAPEK